MAKTYTKLDGTSVPVVMGATLETPDPYERSFYPQSRPSVLSIHFFPTSSYRQVPAMAVGFSEHVQIGAGASMDLREMDGTAVAVVEAEAENRFVYITLPADFDLSTRLTVSIGDAISGSWSGEAVVAKPFGESVAGNLLEIVPSEHLEFGNAWRAD